MPGGTNMEELEGNFANRSIWNMRDVKVQALSLQVIKCRLKLYKQRRSCGSGAERS